MSDCSKHLKTVLGESDMRKVAEAIGDLHYETLAELLYELREKIYKDGQKDFVGGRTKLSNTLFMVQNHLLKASDWMKQAWRISKTYMK